MTPALPAPNSGRAIIVGREIGKLGDYIGAGIMDGHAGGRGMRRAAGDAPHPEGRKSLI